MAKKRNVYRVKPSKSSPGSWDISWNRQLFETTSRKKTAVATARAEAKVDWEFGILAQLVVHGRDGKIQYENTYGADPKRSKG